MARAGRPQGFGSVTPVVAAAGSDAGIAVAQLAGRLRVGTARDAQGVALSRLLLIDPDSPLYCDERGDVLWAAARRALLRA